MEQYVKYLRKSRFDRDYAELSIEETLKRHEAILDKLAAQRGYYIAKTYYEVVSGESIAARPEIQKLLEEVNAGFYAGVLLNVWQEETEPIRRISVRCFSFPEQRLSLRPRSMTHPTNLMRRTSSLACL